MTQQVAPPPLLLALVRLAALQREAVDRLALQEAVAAAGETAPAAQLATVARHLQVAPARWRDSPDAADLPALIVAPDGRWGILRARNAAGQWISDWFDLSTQRWQEQTHDVYPDHRIATLKLLPPYRASQSPVLRLTVDEVLAHKGLLAEAAVGGLLIAFLGLLTSFYSMQVYDRVIPTGATQTLLVLTLGIVLAVLLEYVAKRVRSHLYERLIDQVDQRLARTVYLRFLGIRLDQMPASVGSLAGQMRGYESVRGFLVNLTTHLAVDAPFALVFALVIAAIAGPLAYIPLAFFLVALVTGLWQAGRLRQLAQRNQSAANRKTGLLVESVEAAEIIKSGQGGWRMLGRWLASTDESRDIDLSMRRLNESNQYRTAAFQQVAYVLLIAVGAWMASRGELTMGGLIACSILSGRVLNPVTQIGMQISGWANVKAALQGLDALWQLEDDHHGQEQPVHLEHIDGNYRFENVAMTLRGKSALKIGQLQIRAGQKIGVLGPVGAGKTTLLRLLERTQPTATGTGAQSYVNPTDSYSAVSGSANNGTVDGTGDASFAGDNALTGVNGVDQTTTNPDSSYVAATDSPAAGTTGTGDAGLYGSDAGTYVDNGLDTSYLAGETAGQDGLYTANGADSLTDKIDVYDGQAEGPGVVGEAEGSLTDTASSTDGFTVTQNDAGFAAYSWDSAVPSTLQDAQAGYDTVNHFQVGTDLIALEGALAQSTVAGETVDVVTGDGFVLSSHEFGLLQSGASGVVVANLTDADAVAAALNTAFEFNLRTTDNSSLNTTVFGVTASDDATTTAIWVHTQASTGDDTVDAQELSLLGVVHTTGEEFTAANFAVWDDATQTFVVPTLSVMPT